MKTLTIATRGSKLALWQANYTRTQLLETSKEDLHVELLVLKTKGDRILNMPLAKIGGKGLFVKEIEAALLDGRADIAVHSMKDVPSTLEEGLYLSAISKRADARDAFVSKKVSRLLDLPQGAVVGTSSLRRGCQILALRPDIEIRSLRGNVPTRLSKLDEGDFDAIILAAAGLERLGFADRIAEYLDVLVSIPAVGQGALGIETRKSDSDTSDLVRRALHHELDASCILAERAFLLKLEGGCQTPLGAHAHITEDELHIAGFVGEPDGTRMLKASECGKPSDAEELGHNLAATLLAKGAGAILETLIEAAKKG